MAHILFLSGFDLVNLNTFCVNLCNNDFVLLNINVIKRNKKLADLIVVYPSRPLGKPSTSPVSVVDEPSTW